MPAYTGLGRARAIRRSPCAESTRSRACRMSGLRSRAMSTTWRNVGGACAAAPASAPSWIHASTPRPSRAGRSGRLRPLCSCCRVIRALPLFRRRTGARSVASDVADRRAVWVPAPKRKEGNERNAAEDAMGRSLCEILRGLALIIVDSFATRHVHCAAPRTPPAAGAMLLPRDLHHARERLVSRHPSAGARLFACVVITLSVGGCSRATPGRAAENAAAAPRDSTGPASDFGLREDVRGVATAAVQATSVSDYVDVPARIAADPTRGVRGYAPLSGRLIAVQVRPSDTVQ